LDRFAMHLFGITVMMGHQFPAPEFIAGVT
jgi:hypothetical protein